MSASLDAALSASAGVTSAFFQALIRHCAARARARSVVAISSATMPSMSPGSRIEKRVASPSAAASPRRILRPSEWNVQIDRRFGAVALRPRARDDALAHFARGLVGERDRGDARRLEAALDQVRDLGGDHARLAAARAGQHEQRAVEVSHRGALRLVERKFHAAEL